MLKKETKNNMEDSLNEDSDHHNSGVNSKAKRQKKGEISDVKSDNGSLIKCRLTTK